MLVRGLKIRKIFATTAVPTIEIDLRTKKGTVRSSVPMGTSAGKHEAVTLTADDAIRKFALVARQFRTESFDTQEDVDLTLRAIDKSLMFREIGGNVALGVSSAFLKAFALDAGMDIFEYVYEQTKQSKPNMPMPLCNVIGGWHGQSDIQEFLLLPVHQKSFANSAALLSEAYHKTKKGLKKEDTSFAYGKNVESAWVTALNHETVLRVLAKVANEKLLKIGLDVAASHMWNGNAYIYRYNKLTRTDQLNFIEDLAKRFPIVYIEDPFEEDDFVSHATLSHRVGSRVMVCGDDLYATNLQRLREGMEHKATNTVLVKPNQVGTITDTVKFVQHAKKSGMKTVMSHRSGETEDTLICHLAVGLSCDYIKLGIAGDRTTKINEMIRIEEEMV
jgi:enolase